MPPKKVFGKRGHVQHDDFASMLHSSPDARIADKIKVSEGQEQCRDKTHMRASPPKKSVSALQSISINVSRPPKKRPSRCKKVPGERQLNTRHRQSEPTAEKTLPGKHAPDRRHSSMSSKRQDHSAKSADVPSQRRAEHAHAQRQGMTQADAALEPCSASVCPYTQHCQPLLQLFKQEVEEFSAWSSQLSEHLDVSKIAEASFGEVYRLSLKTSTKLPGVHVSYHEESVLKIIALTPPESTIPTTKRERNKCVKKAALMSKPADVASEVRLLQRMSHIPGFTEFREMRLLKGRPTSLFVKAYKQYNTLQQSNGKESSTFPDPAKKSSYSPDQLWAVIEMRDAGTDLERLVEKEACKDIWSIWDIFWQTALALAKGEEGAEFEHRDLHLGNICVRDKGSSIEVDKEKRLHFTGLDVTLIDYTISRATIAPNAAPGSSDIAYLDLSDDQHIFNGDSAHEYQYDIYRYMRSALFYDDPLAHFDTTCSNSNKLWAQFHPQTNLVWLHFVLYTLLQQMQPARSSHGPANKAERALSKKARELEKTLNEVNHMLDPGHVIGNGLRSTGMLVAMALDREWLYEEDVLGPEESAMDLVEEMAVLRMSDAA